MSTYPEHEKMAKVADESQSIGAFLDWLNGEGVVLAKWGKEKYDHPYRYGDIRLAAGVDVMMDIAIEQGDLDDDFPSGTRSYPGELLDVTAGWIEQETSERLIPTYDKIEPLLARYFDIDLDKIEAEKRAMLDAIRSLNAQTERAGR